MPTNSPKNNLIHDDQFGLTWLDTPSTNFKHQQCSVHLAWTLHCLLNGQPPANQKLYLHSYTWNPQPSMKEEKSLTTYCFVLTAYNHSCIHHQISTMPSTLDQQNIREVKKISSYLLSRSYDDYIYLSLSTLLNTMRQFHAPYTSATICHTTVQCSESIAFLSQWQPKSTNDNHVD